MKLVLVKDTLHDQVIKYTEPTEIKDEIYYVGIHGEVFETKPLLGVGGAFEGLETKVSQRFKVLLVTELGKPVLTQGEFDSLETFEQFAERYKSKIGDISLLINHDTIVGTFDDEAMNRFEDYVAFQDAYEPFWKIYKIEN